MGDRAHVIFFDPHAISPTVYLHWHGDAVPELLDQLRERMAGRFGDATYAAARFIGICHERISGNLSLGVYRNLLQHSDLHDAEAMALTSPGNAGVVVVNTRGFTWQAFGGYLALRATERRSV